jgi:hypothetical protein
MSKENRITFTAINGSGSLRSGRATGLLADWTSLFHRFLFPMTAMNRRKGKKLICEKKIRGEMTHLRSTKEKEATFLPFPDKNDSLKIDYFKFQF